MAFNFLKKSIFNKFIVLLLIVVLLLFIAENILIFYGIEVIPVELITYTGILLTLVLAFIAYITLVNPLASIIQQVKNLLVGQPYNKVYTSRIDEVGIFSHFFNEVTRNIEKLSKQLKDGKRMSSELEIASQIQKGILPTESPKTKGLKLMAKTQPASEVGGDSYDFFETKDNTYMYIGDVTGHGVPAGLVMTMVNILLDAFTQNAKDGKEVIVTTNNILQPKISSSMFMTCILLRFEHSTKKLFYVGAGHEHIIIYRSKSGTCEAQKAGGIALGMIPDNSQVVQEQEINLEEGDTVILFTDGIIEAKNTRGEMFGLDGLISACERYCYDPDLDKVFQNVANTFSKFVDEHIQEDDITLMLVRQDSTSTPAPSKTEKQEEETKTPETPTPEPTPQPIEAPEAKEYSETEPQFKA